MYPNVRLMNSSQCCRSFVLADLCDKVDVQNLGPSISLISGYIEGRLAVIKNSKVGGTTQAMT